MASWMSYFGGRKDPKQTARDAIVGLREQLMMIEKKEEHLNREIEACSSRAKANATTNKRGAYYIYPHRSYLCLSVPLCGTDTQC